MKYLYLYLALVPVFFFIDFFWINYVAKGLYEKNLGDLIQFNLPAAAVFYLVYIVGIIIFAVQPAITSGQWHHALMWGALFGFFTYATYDMTNLATLKNWPLDVAIYDTLWGTFLAASVATSGFYIAQFLKI
jgi:uncharacterized membrane protein